MVTGRGVEGSDDGAEQVGERPCSVAVQVVQEQALLFEQAVEGGVDAAATLVGEPTPDTPRRSPGSGSRATRPFAASRSTRLVIVPDVTIVSRISRPGESSYGVPGATQRRQHVELPRLQLVRRERLPPGEVEVTRQPGDPGQHAHRVDVEVGALALPRLDQPVDLVRRHASQSRPKPWPSRLLTPRQSPNASRWQHRSMTAPVIVVSGLPASGKTTLARRLSAVLRLPLLSLDTIKEAIVDEITVEDRFAVRSAAREIVARLVQDSPAGCLVDIWVNPVRDTRDVADRLGAIAGVRYLEVVCRVPTEQAVERYAVRTRHPAHLAAGDDDALARIREAGPKIGSLGLGPAYDVDTSDESDARGTAGRRARLAGATRGERPRQARSLDVKTTCLAGSILTSR